MGHLSTPERGKSPTTQRVEDECPNDWRRLENGKPSTVVWFQYYTKWPVNLWEKSQQGIWSSKYTIPFIILPAAIQYKVNWNKYPLWTTPAIPFSYNWTRSLPDFLSFMYPFSTWTPCLLLHLTIYTQTLLYLDGYTLASAVAWIT